MKIEWDTSIKDRLLAQKDWQERRNAAVAELIAQGKVRATWPEEPEELPREEQDDLMFAWFFSRLHTPDWEHPPQIFASHDARLYQEFIFWMSEARRDERRRLAISLLSGVFLTTTIPKDAECPRCGGSRVIISEHPGSWIRDDKGEWRSKCPECKGAGRVGVK